MHVATFEGAIENGEIRLKPNVRLPENTQVFVIVPNYQPNYQTRAAARIVSPRLARPEQAIDFYKEVTEVSTERP